MVNSLKKTMPKILYKDNRRREMDLVDLNSVG
jgi:hypothetical protein